MVKKRDHEAQSDDDMPAWMVNHMCDDEKSSEDHHGHHHHHKKHHGKGHGEHRSDHHHQKKHHGTEHNSHHEDDHHHHRHRSKTGSHGSSNSGEDGRKHHLEQEEKNEQVKGTSLETDRIIPTCSPPPELSLGKHNKKDSTIETMSTSSSTGEEMAFIGPVVPPNSPRKQQGATEAPGKPQSEFFKILVSRRSGGEEHAGQALSPTHKAMPCPKSPSTSLSAAPTPRPGPDAAALSHDGHGHKVDGSMRSPPQTVGKEREKGMPSLML
ncbi:hypothetical protein GUITHDRAFT_154058 [Guillardia theta CCMP2712]|uniref:Uncharacterized protein n=2 Tax=Guillardia theta TaxID=55529 RepID=L1IX62_GUITC|nr:hypothetical protein GUITHDRAFT_154058 [Guillardia theta CCMP2712]EKX40697.1 hypothetical protein GUITHDRAFT_154058 [Guillardia theta CCMP2712]|mmetsp:Transcript_40726/g.128371  ORF Transcript_40726/g.128371 Transcript_40726/m.128371 type:complete len:268 (+) Transcript_40726:17-820(+)|eukprot:XP_005827677.1 hypothetical protein GUITHDRAFT_154058 [Guillardia theta CCMP2712]